MTFQELNQKEQFVIINLQKVVFSSSPKTSLLQFRSNRIKIIFKIIILSLNKFRSHHNNKFNRFKPSNNNNSHKSSTKSPLVITPIIFTKSHQAKAINNSRTINRNNLNNINNNNLMVDNHPSLKEKYQEEM